MKIATLDHSLRDGCARLLERRPDALIYQSLPYQDLLCEMLGVQNETAVACDENRTVRGMLPILKREGHWGPVYNSLPFYGSNGGIISDDSRARDALIGWYNSLASNPAVASCTLIGNPLAEDDSGAAVGHNLVDSRIGQLSPIDVGNDSALLMERFHYKTRNMIRKAEKSGIKVTVDNDAWAFLKEIHYENLATLGGMAKPPAFFELLPRHFKADLGYRIYTARLDQDLVAAVLLLYFNRTVEYFVPVIKKAYRDLQPMSLLIYTAMCDAARAGYAWWNWGGTWHSQEGVYRFKSRWGTVDRPYTYRIQLNRPELRHEDRQKLLDAYPFFYVLPFSAALN